jgi:hypothetical protein
MNAPNGAVFCLIMMLYRTLKESRFFSDGRSVRYVASFCIVRNAHGRLVFPPSKRESHQPGGRHPSSSISPFRRQKPPGLQIRNIRVRDGALEIVNMNNGITGSRSGPGNRIHVRPDFLHADAEMVDGARCTGRIRDHDNIEMLLVNEVQSVNVIRAEAYLNCLLTG